MTAMSLGGHISQAIRCTFPKCTCECFSSTKNQIRTCQSCKHGWVAHAVDKLISASNPFSGVGAHTEPISPSIVFDIASLVLYGCQAIPIRLKVSLDRLFSALQHEEVLQILHGFGWSYEDYARGYILQDPSGRVLEKYCIITREEEGIVLQQFIRFAETRNISQELLLQDTKSLQEVNSQAQPDQAKSDSDIRKFIERNNMALIQSYNLALRRAFDTPQSILSAMGAGFPPHLNIAAAAAASQMNRVFPSVGGMMPMPTAGFPQIAEPKPEPIITSEQTTRRISSEPYDLTKRSPESHSKSCSPASSASVVGGNNSNVMSFPKLERDTKEEINANDISIKSGMIKQEFSSSARMPLKRPITPPSSKQGWPFNNPAFGQTVFVTTSGKKRVLCTACNKTFCDKGALKIHYSAVHLKEMHNCTIPGCNMMFSSRRSRNRHSANPNPKLHTPQIRRAKERYENDQDRMMAMMGIPSGSNMDGSNMDNDCNSSVEDVDIHEMSQDKLSGDFSRRSNIASDDEVETEYCREDVDLDGELPTQVKIQQDSPLFKNNKRKRLMPTRVPTSSTQAAIDEDAKSENGISVSSMDLRSEDDNINVDDGREPHDDDIAFGSKTSSERELGEVRSRSPVEPGEVIRKENGDDNKTKYVPKFAMSSPDKQVSVMQSLFSSFLPPNTDNHQGNAFWSSFIQHTAAAAQNATNNQELNVEDNSDNESDISVKAADENTYCCTIDGCISTFTSRESRDLHSMNIKLHCKMFENNQKVDTNNEAESHECVFCDKLFPTQEVLSKHIHAVHQGQESLYNDQNFTTQIDSIKSKTPVIA